MERSHPPSQTLVEKGSPTTGESGRLKASCGLKGYESIFGLKYLFFLFRTVVLLSVNRQKGPSLAVRSPASARKIVF